MGSYHVTFFFCNENGTMEKCCSLTFMFESQQEEFLSLDLFTHFVNAGVVQGRPLRVKPKSII